MSKKNSTALSVIHVLRTPVGGLFRHVCDVAKMQSEMGMQVGIFCDSNTGGENAEKILDHLQAVCSLGVYRCPIGRLPGIGDLAAIYHLRDHLQNKTPDILHGHGAKGGAYARLLAHSIGAKAIYTPHGGSLHYSTRSPVGFVFLKLEHLLGRYTDGIIFECAFAQETYRRKVGNPSCAMRVIHNGISDADFHPLMPNDTASDFVFIGELRKLKGVDILLHALAKVSNSAKRCSCTIVGDGPGAEIFRQLTYELGLGDCVNFTGFKPASEGFSMGRHLVIPSRAESFPYIILEGAAAGLPIITTHVGGIAEIFGDQSSLLVAPDNVDALSLALETALSNPEEMKVQARVLQNRVKTRFTVSTMTAATVDFYSKV